jgi:LysM repeat protein
MPTIPRWVLALGALVIAAVVIFSLPFLLNLGGASGIPTPSQSVAPSDAGQSSSGPSASTPVVPSQKVYTVVSGDTITKIAKRFGLSTTQLLAANPQIKNANNIKPGDKITIPSAAPSDEVTGASPGASPAPS